MAYLGSIRIPTKYRDYLPTGERVGSTCPPGEVVIGTGIERGGAQGRQRAMVACGLPPPPKPAAPPPPAQAPQITVETTVSPNMQQAFTPQFAPTMQMSSGSGSQSAGQTQSAPGGQSAASPSGTNAADLIRLLAQQRDEQAQRDTARREEQERRDEQRREEERLREERRLQEQMSFFERLSPRTPEITTLPAQVPSPQPAPIPTPQPAPTPQFIPGGVSITPEPSENGPTPTPSKPFMNLLPLLIAGGIGLTGIVYLVRKKTN